jgi:hypothetical protein
MLRIIMAAQKPRRWQHQVRHATGSNAAAELFRVNQNHKVDGAFHWLDPGAVATKLRL